jgi:hypothetical protein
VNVCFRFQAAASVSTFSFVAFQKAQRAAFCLAQPCQAQRAAFWLAQPCHVHSLWFFQKKEKSDRSLAP